MKVIKVFIVLFLLLSTVVIPQANVNKKLSVQELDQQLQTAPAKQKMDILMKLIYRTVQQAPDKCIDYCNRLLEIEKKMNRLDMRAFAQINLGYAYNAKGEEDLAIHHCKTALEIYRSVGDKESIAKALEGLGLFYMAKDFLNTAQDYLLKALKIRQELGNKKSLYTSYMYFGFLYDSLEDYKKSMFYYRKALSIVNRKQSMKSFLYCKYCIGVCFQKQEDYKNALKYLLEALELAKSMKDKYTTASVLNYLGRVYWSMDRQKLALQHLSQAKQIRETNGYTSGLGFTYYYLGCVYLKLKDYDNALIYYNKTLEVEEHAGGKKRFEEVYRDYSRLFAEIGDYKTALEYHKKFFQVRESILNKKKLKQIADLEQRFEAETREKEIELLKKDNKIQRLTRNVFIIGLILLMVVLAFVFKKYLYLLAFWKTHKYVGQYRIIEKIGTGGMGSVYRAHAVNDKTNIVAVKVLREELGDNEVSRRRFKQEGIIIDKLEHPNIVKIHERGQHKDNLYIAMEFLEGKTLTQRIHEGNISWQECFHIMIQLTDALCFIHSKKVLHRDIKPANIMMIPSEDGNYTVKLLDFGVALMEFQTRLTQSGILVGTISYTAPEEITDNTYSQASDIYSLGATFYELVTGKLVFPALSVTAMIEKILDQFPREPIELRPDIPGELNLLVMRMLSKTPQQRPTAPVVMSTLEHIKENS